MITVTLIWSRIIICLLAFVTLFLSISIIRLSAKRKTLDVNIEQINLSCKIYLKEICDEKNNASKNILENKPKILD